MDIVITTAHWTKTSSWMKNCTKFSQLILSKIIEIDPTSCHISRLKCTKFDFGWVSASDPAEGVHSAPPSLAEFNGPISMGRGGTGEKKGKGKERDGRDSGWGEGGEERRGREGRREEKRMRDEREGRVASS